jgi:hypothetical protein
MAKKQPSRKVSSEKACEIMEHGSVHEKKLTSRQKGLFGAACGRGRKK